MKKSRRQGFLFFLTLVMVIGGFGRCFIRCR